MAYVTPRTWTSGDFLTAMAFNQEIRDNTSYLKTRVDAGFPYGFGATSAISSTSSTTFANIHAELNITVDVKRGYPVFFIFSGNASHTAVSGELRFRILFDGLALLGHPTYGMQFHMFAATGKLVPFTCSGMIDGLSVGSHTLVPQFATSGGTLSTGNFWSSFTALEITTGGA